MKELDVVQGTLDLLVLQALAGGTELHGYAILAWLRRTTDEELRVEDAALYPALHRLESRGLVSARWGRSDNNRRARYYKLTRAGSKALAQQAATWRRYVGVVERVLRQGA